MNKVIWQPKALKQLQRIGDKKLRQRLYTAGSGLSAFPDCPNIKALKNHQYAYRLRVGDWRLFFAAYETEMLVISIEEVKKRDERTY